MRYWGARPRHGHISWNKHFRPIAWITVSILCVNVYANLDSVILGFFTSPREVGLYNAAMRPCRLLVFLLASFTTAALPRLAHYLESGNEAASKDLSDKSFDLLCLIMFPISFTLATGAYQIIAVVLGKNFTVASNTMVYAAPLVIFGGLANFLGNQILFSRKGERYLALATALGAISSLIAGFFLIPLWGRNGTVISVLVAESVVIVTCLFYALRFRFLQVAVVFQDLEIWTGRPGNVFYPMVFPAFLVPTRFRAFYF